LKRYPKTGSAKNQFIKILLKKRKPQSKKKRKNKKKYL